MTILHMRIIPGLRSAAACPRQLSEEDMKDAEDTHQVRLQTNTAVAL
jgi:hypothetical protein